MLYRKRKRHTVNLYNIKIFFYKYIVYKKMSYYCHFCKYKTCDSGNYYRHKKTKKHILLSDEKVNNIKITVDKLANISITDTNVSNKLALDSIPTVQENYFCPLCKINFKHNSSLSRHKKKCIKTEELNIIGKMKIEFYEKENELIKKMENDKTTLLTEMLKEKTKLINMAMNNASNKINQLIDNNRSLLDTIHYIDNNESDSDFDNHIIKTINDNNLLSEKSKTLILNNVTIVSRITDNYINATQLCKAGNKKFNDWFRIDTTKILISTLEGETGIPASQLVDIKKGNSFDFEQGSWIHPDLAIQLAQWLSPKFALQVSKWIRTLFSNSKVEVSLKLLKNKEKELEVKNKKIKLLENLHIKKQKREDYPENNVIYIITTKENKNNRIYIIGKAKDLKSRLSTYNKTAEHEVIYYKGCKNEDNMNIVEQMVLLKLNNYREQANRDRFILSENQDISLFKNIIDNSIKFFE